MHGDWQGGCGAAEETVHCSIKQTQVRGENRRRLLAVELTNPNGGTVKGTMVLPLGLKLNQGGIPSIYRNARMRTRHFSTRLRTGCIVPLAFDATTVTALWGGTKLRLRAIVNDSGQEAGFTVSLSGFASALAREKELGES